MAEIAFDRFEGGLDRRYNRPVGGANILWVLKNAYITTGKKIKKRPCFVNVARLEAGTKGLKAAGGVLNTFYGQGTITHANPLFLARKVSHPSLALDVAKCHYAEMFNGFLYTAVEYTNGDVKHHYLDGTAPAYIVDANCPNSKNVVKLSQKIYASRANGDVGFCATALPRNWTGVSDAGTIASATSASGSEVLTALGIFNNDLAVFYKDGIQVWHVDPDPTLNALKSSSNSSGTAFSKAGQTLAQDFVYLAKAGFRSLSIAVLTNNLQENDVGSAIDKLRSEILDTDDPRTIYFPALGQLLCFNGTKVYAYSFSRSNKLAAWSTFEFPFTVDDVAVLSSDLYARSGDTVYRFDPLAYNDAGVVPLVEAEMFFQDGKAPGIEKTFTGFDSVFVGNPDVAFRYDPRDESLITEFVSLLGKVEGYGLFLPGSILNYAYTADSVASSITGNIDLRIHCAPDAWTAADYQALIMKDFLVAPQRDYGFAISPLGKLYFYYTNDGGDTTGRIATSSVATGFAERSRHWCRVTYDTATGEVKFYTSIDYDQLTESGSWTQLGTTQVITAGTIHDGTYEVHLGIQGTTASLFSGTIYYAEIRNGIGGPIVARFEPPGEVESFTSDTGELWTVRTNGGRIAKIVPFSLPSATGDSRPGDLFPMELCATSVAPIFNHQADEDFQLDQMLLYYEKLGPV